VLRAAARSSTNQALDWENLAEEIESLGRSNRRELRSRYTAEEVLGDWFPSEPSKTPSAE
jgi:hypothetical protein